MLFACLQPCSNVFFNNKIGWGGGVYKQNKFMHKRIITKHNRLTLLASLKIACLQPQSKVFLKIGVGGGRHKRNQRVHKRPLTKRNRSTVFLTSPHFLENFMSPEPPISNLFQRDAISQALIPSNWKIYKHFFAGFAKCKLRYSYYTSVSHGIRISFISTGFISSSHQRIPL